MADENPSKDPTPAVDKAQADAPNIGSVAESPVASETRPVSDPFLDAQLRAAGKDSGRDTSAPPKPSQAGVASPVAAPKSRRNGVGLGTVIVLSTLAAVGGAGLALAALSQPVLLERVGLAPPASQNRDDPGAATSQLAKVAARLVDLEGRVRQLEARPNSVAAQPSSSEATAAPPAAPAEAAALKIEMDGIAGRLTAIETRLAALDPTGAGGAVIAGLQSDIASLKALVQGLQSQAAQAPAPGVTFAVINLVEAASRPGPFWPEFETVRAAMPGTAEVAALEEFARKGAPTRVLLQERFAALGPAIETADREALKQSGFWGWLKSLFSGLVRVEQVASETGTSPQSSLLRAKLKLDQGDLSAAIEEVKAINPAPELVKDWLSGAEARLALEARLAALRGAVERGGRNLGASPAPAPSSPIGIIPASPPPNRATTGTAPQNGQGTLP